MTASLARVPPHDIAAEDAVIGALLLEGKAAVAHLCAAGVRPEDFYLEANRVTFQACCWLEAHDQAVDVITVDSRLREVGDLDLVGGPARLALCLEQASIAAHLDAYVDILLRHARRRLAIQMATQVITEAFSEASVEELERRLLVLGEQMRLRRRPDFDAAGDWRDIVARWHVKHPRFGWLALDRMLGGLDAGTFLVLAARTSHGKTAMLVAMALQLARQGFPVELISLEESRAAIVRRLIAADTGVATIRIKSGLLGQEELHEAEASVARLQELPLVVSGVTNLAGVEEPSVVGAVAVSSAQIVLLDHIQQVTTRDDSRTYGIERVLTELVAAALRDGKVLIAASQCRREMDERRGPPQLADISDSSAIEKKARVVLLGYWPSKHKVERNPEEYELYVAKNADGGTGLVRLRFEYPCGRFSELQEHEGAA